MAELARRRAIASSRAAAAKYAYLTRTISSIEHRTHARPSAVSAGAEPAIAASSSRDPAQSPPSATPPPQSQSRRDAERERAAEQPPQSTPIWHARRRALSIALAPDKARRRPARSQPSPRAAAAIPLNRHPAPRRHLNRRVGATPSASEQPSSRRKASPSAVPNVGHRALHSRPTAARRRPAPSQPSPLAVAAISLASGSPRAPRRHH